ncbi:cytochrome P450 4C1 [Plutella xylostella]|uniref:cytochrome P450 4C1 n=1 Tax=Plutella xylostella TaxID=51655 RepID=UPI002032677C|nr:cytochrome P450 4C1 [Plutella xylostella]
MILLVCAATPVLILVLLSLYWRFSHAGRLMAKIPPMKGRRLPVFGNMFDFWVNTERMFALMRDTARERPGLTRIQALSVNMVNVYSPDDIEKLLSNPKFNEKGVPYTFFKPWLCDGLLISNGDKWFRRRKILTPAFHFQVLRQFSRSFTAHTAALLAALQREVTRDATDLDPVVSKATLTIMCETSMGTSMHEGLETVSQKYFDAINHLGSIVAFRLSRILLHTWATFSLTSSHRLQKKLVKDLHEFTDKIIMERKVYRQSETHKALAEASAKRKDEDDDVSVGYGRKGLAMLDLLLDSADEGKIDAIGIREEVDTFMFEGHDTTARALCFLLMSIANEPSVQDTISSELQDIFLGSDRPPTVEDLQEMKYLECCIREGLRLYPSVPYIARLLKEDTVLSGYVVPAGTIVNIHVFDVHRRAELFPEPEAFRPERWLAPPPHKYAYVPFSAGPRNCIGQKFAMLELKTVLSGVLRRYRLEPVTRPQDLVFHADITLKTTNPIYVRFRNRT